MVSTPSANKHLITASAPVMWVCPSWLRISSSSIEFLILIISIGFIAPGPLRNLRWPWRPGWHIFSNTHYGPGVGELSSSFDGPPILVQIYRVELNFLLH